jgi:predicted Zn-ribbon and HTH transcriptional regulator
MSYEIDQERVYFRCRVCGYVFEEDPWRMPVLCPQCGFEDTERM